MCHFTVFYCGVQSIPLIALSKFYCCQNQRSDLYRSLRDLQWVQLLCDRNGIHEQKRKVQWRSQEEQRPKFEDPVWLNDEVIETGSWILIPPFIDFSTHSRESISERVQLKDSRQIGRKQVIKRERNFRLQREKISRNEEWSSSISPHRCYFLFISFRSLTSELKLHIREMPSKQDQLKLIPLVVYSGCFSTPQLTGSSWWLTQNCRSPC